MEFSIELKPLVKILSLCSSIADKKHTMPILSSVKLVAEDEILKVYSTDLEVSLYGEVKASVVSPGEIALNAKILFEIVRELHAETAEFKLIDNSRLEVVCGKSNYSIVASSTFEFPGLTGVKISNPVMVNSEKLHEMFGKTMFAITPDESRYNINGLFVESIENAFGVGGAGIRFVSTDGHRIAIIDRPADGLFLDRGILIPRKGVSELMRLLSLDWAAEGETQVEVVNEYFTVKNGPVVLGIRLSDGVFPNYRQILPKNQTTSIIVSREEFGMAVKRAAIVTTEIAKSIIFNVKDGVLELEAFSAERGEAREQLAVTQSGENVFTSFSSKYLLDLMSVFSDSDDLVIALDGAEGPGSFSFKSDDHYNCVMMPMRISELKRAA